MTALKLLACAAMLVGGAASASADEREPVYGKPAAISFAANGGIRDWHAEDDSSVYIRDRTGRWYLATLSGPCPGLLTSQAVSFKTDAMGRFDRFGAIRADFIDCAVDKLVTSPAPAAKGGPRADAR